MRASAPHSDPSLRLEDGAGQLVLQLLLCVLWGVGGIVDAHRNVIPWTFRATCGGVMREVRGVQFTTWNDTTLPKKTDDVSTGIGLRPVKPCECSIPRSLLRMFR